MSLPTSANGSLSTHGPLAERMDALAAHLAQLAPKVHARVGRPHPLLASLLRDACMVVFVPARVWDKGRTILSPFAPLCAEGKALLLLVGRPTSRDFTRAGTRNLGRSRDLRGAGRRRVARLRAGEGAADGAAVFPVLNEL